MAASKDKEVKPVGLQKLAQWMQYVPGGALIFAVIPLLVISYFAWRHWGAHHVDQALYALRLENLVTTPQPTWIRNSKVRDEVFHSGGLGQLSLLDPQASATIAHAFESHSWVQRTTYVKKNSDGKVNVDIVYRRPVAMVYYPGSSEVIPGFFPVDEEGVVLPKSDFDSSQVTSFFMIYADGAAPPNDIGMAFSDIRVRQALALCRFLEPSRIELRLEGIYVERDLRMGGPSPWIMRIRTSDNRAITWGHAPGVEMNGEPDAQTKLAALLRWHNSSNSTIEIDLTKSQPQDAKLTSGSF